MARQPCHSDEIRGAVDKYMIDYVQMFNGPRNPGDKRSRKEIRTVKWVETEWEEKCRRGRGPDENVRSRSERRRKWVLHNKTMYSKSYLHTFDC